MSSQLVLILDFGGQVNQLIARRVRDNAVYCEVKPHTLPADEIKARKPIGVILTGGPTNASAAAPSLDPAIFGLGIPVLAIGYGMTVMAKALGGNLSAQTAPSGGTHTRYNTDSKLFYGLPPEGKAWVGQGNSVDTLPVGFVAVASADSFDIAAMENVTRRLYGLQFHPEMSFTDNGNAMLKSFLYSVCGAQGDWTMSDFMRLEIERIRARVGEGKVLLALSGGVDSSVCAALVERAVGDKLTCIYVDTGLMRKNESVEIESVFGGKSGFIRVDAEKRFLDRLKGITDPETKRKTVGEEFIRVFEDEAKKIGTVDYLVQGTIYPDVIESGEGDAAVIKSHHNVGGLPDHVDFKEIIEPLRLLFKDEVRQLGKELGLPEKLVWRQPFPGPGLSIRVIGEVTKEKLDLLRDADFIFRDEVAKAGLARSVSQYFAVLTDMRSVGVTGDSRTYDYTLALRGVTTTDFMTAEWARIPFDVLERASTRIVAECGHINRIVYDVTSKPPATIEWE